MESFNFGVFKCMALLVSIENTYDNIDVGSTLNQAYALSLVSYVFLKESDR